MTVQYQYPVRVNMPVTLGIYTFTDANTGLVIDLSSDFAATAVYCEVKRIDDTWNVMTDTLTGSIVSAVGGTVKVESYEFLIIGQWNYQFYCVNSGGDKLWGEPVVFAVVKNTENLLRKEQINP